MDEEHAMGRRTFLGGLTAASFGVWLENAFAGSAFEQASKRSERSMAGQDAFDSPLVDISGNIIFVRRYGKGPAILLVHGFPRTSLMWRMVAPKLAERHTVICADLRAYGRSGTPASTDDHFPYSKRAIANELVDVMTKLGFSTFTLIGHDRGGRVSYRMALDHPNSIERLAVFDVIPIFEAWSRSDARFARTYWPWILLSQKQPLPESYLLGAPEAVSITRSAKAPLAQKFSKSTFPPIAIPRACTASVKNIEPPRRSISNMIVRTKKRRTKSNARCCTCGRRAVRSTLSMD